MGCMCSIAFFPNSFIHSSIHYVFRCVCVHHIGLFCFTLSRVFISLFIVVVSDLALPPVCVVCVVWVCCVCGVLCLVRVLVAHCSIFRLADIYMKPGIPFSLPHPPPPPAPPPPPPCQLWPIPVVVWKHPRQWRSRSRRTKQHQGNYMPSKGISSLSSPLPLALASG